MGMLDNWDDKDTAFGLASLLILANVPVELLKDTITALAPVWTAIVSAIAGAITGRRPL